MRQAAFHALGLLRVAGSYCLPLGLFSAFSAFATIPDVTGPVATFLASTPGSASSFAKAKASTKQQAASVKKVADARAAAKNLTPDPGRPPLETLRFDIQCVQVVNPPAFPTTKQASLKAKEKIREAIAWFEVALAPTPKPTSPNLPASGSSVASRLPTVDARDETSAAAAGAARPSAYSSATPPVAPVITCPSVGPDTLVGAGQILVIVKAADYATAMRSANDEPPRLSLNGFDLGKGAMLLTVEHVPQNGIAVRYQLKPDKDAHTAWGTLYEEFGLTGGADLRVALVWGKSPNATPVFTPNPDLHPRKLYVAVSNRASIIGASLLSAVLAAFFWWAMARTDIFRSSSALFWWAEAQTLRKQIRKALKPARVRKIQERLYEKEHALDSAHRFANATVQTKKRHNKELLERAALVEGGRATLTEANAAMEAAPLAKPAVDAVAPADTATTLNATLAAVAAKVATASRETATTNTATTTTVVAATSTTTTTSEASGGTTTSSTGGLARDGVTEAKLTANTPERAASTSGATTTAPNSEDIKTAAASPTDPAVAPAAAPTAPVLDAADPSTAHGRELSQEVLRAIQANAHGGPNFNSSFVPHCLALAQAALQDNEPLNEADMHATVVGLALFPTKWKPVRAAFSLSAVQVGVWMMFVAVAGVFLWLVYWQIPALPQKMLALVTITGLTAAASWLADPTTKFYRSTNLLTDLVTGSNGDMRVHRFQAVLVNGLLLFVGIFSVMQTLDYPDFDPSWLEFLGLSGLLQTVGKKILEPAS